MENKTLTLPLGTISTGTKIRVQEFLSRWSGAILLTFLTVLSIGFFVFFSQSGMTLAYNDARSHLNIGRRVVEGLKPGLAQIGSVWLPLPHLLMIPTIWNDWMWHTGLSGAIQSMISFVATGFIIKEFLKRLGVSAVGQLVGVLVFATNLNILYLQATAMTELLLIATMTATVYYLLLFYQKENFIYLTYASLWVMLATMIRYDGWFLFFYANLLIIFYGLTKGASTLRKGGWIKRLRMAEGLSILFCTMGGLGIFLWLLWNALIFKDPLYFAFGPYSAHAQQAQLESAGVLNTKDDLVQSLETYWYAMSYNSGLFVLILGILGALSLWTDKKIPYKLRLVSTALCAPLAFNIIALYLGHSVLFIQGINGNTWFNVRYGIMMMPSLAIFIGYLVHRFKSLKYVIIGLLAMVTFFQFTSSDAVTMDDGRVGSSQKNVSEVSGWLEKNVKDKKGFVLVSAASHDAIIFSSQLPMKRIIHEGTGTYWLNAIGAPDRWARWIVLRTNDNNDQTFRLINKDSLMNKYSLVNSYPFADIYELKEEYLPQLNTEASLGPQR